MKRRLGFILPNLIGGGAEKNIIKLVRYLQGQGHEVHLILLEGKIQYETTDMVHLHIVARRRRYVASRSLNTSILAWQLKALVRAIEKRFGPFDGFLSSLPNADEVVDRAGLRPVVYSIRNTLSHAVNARYRRSPAKGNQLMRRFQRIYRDKDLVGVSHGTLEDLRTNVGVKPRSTRTIYNPFDREAIRRASCEPLEVPPGLIGERFIINVASAKPGKRHDILLSAYAQSSARRTHKLVLLGEPRESLSALIAAFGLEGEAYAVGFQCNPYAWLRQADRFVLASEVEGLPTALIEALICGTPVVSTDCDHGPREILIGDLARWLVPVNNAPALARAIDQSLAEIVPIPEADLMRFAIEDVAESYRRLVEELATRPNSSESASHAGKGRGYFAWFASISRYIR
jgi:glycosyltransferase involved in cell wall biosynthesis